MPKEIGDMLKIMLKCNGMLQQKEPEDFVIATGRMETVRRFIEITANKLGWRKDSKTIFQ